MFFCLQISLGLGLLVFLCLLFGLIRFCGRRLKAFEEP